MKLSPAIVAALRKAIEHTGTQTAFAAITGVRQNNLARYLSGTIKKVETETWEKLFPHIKPFMTEYELQKFQKNVSVILHEQDDVPHKTLDFIRHICYSKELDTETKIRLIKELLENT